MRSIRLLPAAALAAACMITAVPTISAQQRDSSGNAKTSASAGASGTRTGMLAGMSADRLAVPDSHFVRMAASGSQLEIRLGQYAKQNAKAESVQRFADRMIQDHTKMTSWLQAATKTAEMDMPSGMMPEHEAVYDSLTQLKGSEFDSSYARHMVQDHAQDVPQFAAEAKVAEHPAIRSFASRSDSLLQRHLRLSFNLAQKVGLKPAAIASKARQDLKEKADTAQAYKAYNPGGKSGARADSSASPDSTR